VRLILAGFLSLILLDSAFGQTVTGVVVDGNGAGIEGAAVSLRTTGRPDHRTRTDFEGRFTITGTITSASRLKIVASGFANFDRRLANDGVRDFTIVLQPAGVAGDVTVSITRTEIGLTETPASVAVLTREDLDTSAAQAIDDSLRQVAGFTLFRRSSSKTANPTTHGANLRGVSGSGASRAAVSFDGLSLNDAFGGWTYWSRIPEIAVDRIEVLRGGASSLYGSGGLSGAVNLISTRPEDEGLLLRGQASAGTQNTFDASVFAALSDSGWIFDAAAEAFTTRGYIPVFAAERGAVDTKAGSEHTNSVFGIARRFGIESRDFSGRIFARGNVFSEDRANGTRLTDNATYFRQASAGGDVEGEGIGRFEFRAFIQSQVYDQMFSAIAVDRSTEMLTRVQRVPSQATGISIFWTRSFGDHTVASSAELRRVRGFSDELGFAAGVQNSVSGSGGNENTAAFFIQDLWQAGHKVTLSIGGRYDYWSNSDARTESRSLATNVTTRTIFPDRSQSAFNPRVAAIIAAGERVSFYGAFSRSFRAPTLNELYRGFRVGNVATQANENLVAETANTFEGGVNVRGIQRKLIVRANVFSTMVHDPVVSVTVSSTPSLITRRRQNVGETRSQGIEMDTEFAATPQLRVSGSYLFVDSRITEFPADPALIENVPPQVARHQLSLRLTLRQSSRWSFGAQARAASAQFEDDINSLRLRPYLTIDATSTFRLRRGVEIFAAGENILNSRYDIGLTPNRTVAAPAFVRLGLRFDLSKR
jgi:outer membrane receptor protein involved in Fe transport